MSGMRIVLADDHAWVRAKIRRALVADGHDVCGEGASAQDAVRLAIEFEPDVVLLDIHMPGDGITAAREISSQLPQTAVVMLTASREDEDLFDSLKAGASGYLLKDTDPAELSAALQGVLAGEAAMSPALVSRLIEQLRGPRRSPLTRKSSAASRLSARELEVMELLAEGLSTEEVADRLFLSPTTVRVHVSTSLRKLRVSDRGSAFRLLRGR